MAAREMNPSELRLRLVFNNGVLSKTQKRNGLKRSWVLLKPHFQTICDVVSYIVHSFDLHGSCPHGIILYMDGFVLPEFESISILNDKDLISVKRKETRSLNASKAVQEATTYIYDGIVEKLPLPSGVKLLANEEFDKETGGYQSESEKDEDEGVKSTSPVQNTPNAALASKKRKSSSKLESAKKKRKVQAISNTVQKKHLHESEHITKPKKKRKHESRSNQTALRSPDVMEKFSNELVPESKSESELDENKEDTIQASAMPDKTKKVSRSTLRKKKKRVLKKSASDEAKKVELCERQQPVKDMTMDTGSKKEMVANITQQYDEDSDAEGDLVPVVIRPGLIRFTSSGKVKDIEENQEAKALDVNPTENGTWEDHSGAKNVSDNQIVKEAYCWNGITSKRKGQKWGQTSTWKESRNGNTHSSSAWDDGNQSTSSWQESREINGQFNNTWADKKHHSSNKSVNFDKLIPLVDSPKVGDVIAYRLLELSSSWCPELSPFRVGKVTSFEPESNMIKLVPVPEYPLNLPKNDVDDETPLGSSIYSEDGSLETDFHSLNEVRIMKLGDLTQSEGKIGSSTPTTKKVNEVQDGGKKVVADLSNQKPPTPDLANGKKDVWEEITEAVSAKKAQLMQEDSWNKKETAAKRPWSYRSLRSSAIGPTMARLRSQNAENGA
ncbi:coilin isoform X2 [Silene latifolia]|uniref:coilin isoform X2 n=1 Tax=Silene latifolia TaxID=37657 RepID=UPI003D77DD7B